MTPWEIEAREVANCNCSYGCPCQFNARPTHGNCHAAVGIEIDKGYFGETRLDGLRIGGVFAWPGAIHEGNGEAVAFIDERATPDQRNALLKIMTGQDTDPFATVFAVFASTVTKMHEPVFTRIDLDVDVDGRTARLSIPNYVETSAEAIRNAATGAPSRAQISLPEGFEFTVAEVGSGRTRTRGPVELEMNATHAHLARLHLNNHGVVRA